MPERDWRVLAEDMLTYAERAQGHVADITFAEFELNPYLQDGALRCLELLGEAARHMPDEVRSRAPDIPWGQIVTTRHILAHHYAKVDLELVWDVIQRRLPELKAALKTLLSTLP